MATPGEINGGIVNTAAEPWPVVVLKGLVTIAASPGGLAVLEKIFVDHGLSPGQIDEAIKKEVRF